MDKQAGRVNAMRLRIGVLLLGGFGQQNWRARGLHDRHGLAQRAAATHTQHTPVDFPQRPIVCFPRQATRSGEGGLADANARTSSFLSEATGPSTPGDASACTAAPSNDLRSERRSGKSGRCPWAQGPARGTRRPPPLRTHTAVARPPARRTHRVSRGATTRRCHCPPPPPPPPLSLPR